MLFNMNKIISTLVLSSIFTLQQFSHNVLSQTSFFTHAGRFKVLQEQWETILHTVKDRSDLFQKSKMPLNPLFNSLEQFDEELSVCGRDNVDIRELSISKAQEYFNNGTLSSVDLTMCYIHRISVMNPALNAIIEVNPDAFLIAFKSDIERELGINRGPLHGIPILIKDNIATKDRMKTTAGAKALSEVKPLRDSQVVQRLRANGAVILGKTNLSEFAFFRGTNVPSGWSGRGGQTVNPYNSSVSTSGSSSGSAVAIAANLALLALGTETDGSIASPAARQALVGFKPTKGVVPMDGIIPLAPSQDTVGPMARTVADAAIAFSIVADKTYQHETENDIIPRKFRIGILRAQYWNYTNNPIMSEQKEQLENTVSVLKSISQFETIDPVDSNSQSFYKVTPDAEFTVFLHEFKTGLNQYLREAVEPSNMSSLSSIIDFNEKNPEPLGYNQQILIDSQNTDGVQNSTYINLRDQMQEESRKYLDAAFDVYNLDAVIAPCDEAFETPLIYSMAAIAGYPSITVPAGFRKDLVPFGITFVAKFNEDETLLQIAHLFETSFVARKPPTFKLSVNVADFE